MFVNGVVCFLDCVEWSFADECDNGAFVADGAESRDGISIHVIGM